MKRIAAIILISAGLCAAQTKTPANRFGALKDYLGLSDAQVTSLTELTKQTVANNKDERVELTKKMVEMRRLQRSANPDPNAVAKLQSEVNALREQLRTARSGMSGQAENILTPDQRAKLKALEDAMRLAPAMRQAAVLGLVKPADANKARNALRPRAARPAARAKRP